MSAIRDTGFWFAARWLGLELCDATLIETFGAEARRKGLQRAAKALALRDKAEGKDCGQATRKLKD